MPALAQLDVNSAWLDGEIVVQGEKDAPDFQALQAHGFSDEDIWDIGAITAFFGLSNRIANFSGMLPNPEFYLMGRVAKEKK